MIEPTARFPNHSYIPLYFFCAKPMYLNVKTMNYHCDPCKRAVASIDFIREIING